MGDQKHDSEYTMTYHAVDMVPPYNILDTTNLPENFFLITRIHNNKTKQNFYNVQKYNKTSVIPSNRNNVSQAEIDKYITNGALSGVPHYSSSINLTSATAPAPDEFSPASENPLLHNITPRPPVNYNALPPIQTPFQTSPISNRTPNDQLPETRTTIKPNLDTLVANMPVATTNVSASRKHPPRRLPPIKPNISTSNPSASATVTPYKPIQAWPKINGGRKTHRNKKSKRKHTRRHQTRQRH
jgi:hypothetical protein